LSYRWFYSHLRSACYVDESAKLKIATLLLERSAEVLCYLIQIIRYKNEDFEFLKPAEEVFEDIRKFLRGEK
jgi:hypothetical protein